MSTAPSFLRIKRKRGEEPVESLFVQGSDGSKRIRTGESYVFHRLVKGNEHSYDPQIVTTSEQGSMTTTTSTTSHRQSQRLAFPRRFHLSHSSASTSTDQKARKRSRDNANIAVLVEDRPVATKTRKPNKAVTQSSVVVEQPLISAPQSITKKPPGARYGNPRPPPARKRMQSISQEKRATFEQWAQEEMGAMVVGDSTAPQSVTAPTTMLGASSVANSGSQQEPVSETTTEPDAMDTDEEGEYVYDTYVRHTMQTDNAALRDRQASTGMSQEASKDEAENVGYLVITDLDIELWETYASDPEEADDKDDWDSEQDDENAENYYGADYPEDEVSSDDEQDTNAYRYRTKRSGFSDDEEYDLADNSSEEDELNELEPWKRQQAARTGVYRLGVGELNRRRRLD